MEGEKESIQLRFQLFHRELKILAHRLRYFERDKASKAMEDIVIIDLVVCLRPKVDALV